MPFSCYGKARHSFLDVRAPTRAYDQGTSFVPKIVLWLT